MDLTFGVRGSFYIYSEINIVPCLFLNGDVRLKARFLNPDYLSLLNQNDRPRTQFPVSSYENRVREIC